MLSTSHATESLVPGTSHATTSVPPTTTMAVTAVDRSLEASVPAIAQGLCVNFAPEVSTRCLLSQCTTNSSAFQICFNAWAPGAGQVRGNISLLGATYNGLLATFTSTAGLGPGVFRITWLIGSELGSCERRGLTSLGFPSLTVKEKCGELAAQATSSMFVIQVRGEQGLRGKDVPCQKLSC